MAYKHHEDQLKCQRDWYARNQKKQKQIVTDRRNKIVAWFKEYKSQQSCECGENHPACIVFHHEEGTKKEQSICSMVRNACSIETIKNELKKCKSMCSNCHLKFHFSQFYKGEYFLMKNMEIKPINDGNSNFELVELRDDGNVGRLTPYCKLHGAMLKVSPEGLWRCIQSISLRTGKCVKDCRAGCVEAPVV